MHSKFKEVYISSLYIVNVYEINVKIEKKCISNKLRNDASKLRIILNYNNMHKWNYIFIPTYPSIVLKK